MKKTPTPMLTIVIPVKSRKGLFQNLEKTLEIASKHFLDIEVILVDDDSVEEARAKLQTLATKFEAKYFQVDFCSPGLARNYGLTRASGKWIAFWDHDDIGDASKLLNVLRLAPSQARVVIASFRLVNEVKKSSKEIQAKGSLSKIMMNPGLWRFAFEKSLIANEIFESVKMGEDQLFLAKLNLEMENIFCSSEVVYTYIIGGEEQSTRSTESLLELDKALILFDKALRDGGIKANYAFVNRSKMYLTHMKRFKSWRSKFLVWLFGPREATIQSRIKIILANIKVLNFRIWRI